MENPDTCEHDYRRVYPRHITGQEQTSFGEKVMFILCCRCGKSPLYLKSSKEWREYYRSSAGAFPDWPKNNRITYYEWDQDVNGDGPSVTFEEENAD